MSTDLVKSSPPLVDKDRAQLVLTEMEKIQGTTKKNFFGLCDLLLEAYEGGYHSAWGYSRFGEWIEQCNLDLSGRSAYYFVTIAQRSRELGISKEALANLSLEKLKLIFSLKPVDFGAQMTELIGQAEDLSGDEVKSRVNALKSKAGEEVYTHLNLKIPATVKQIIEEAFELARRLHGSVVDRETGEITDISDGKCLEYISAAFLQDPNNYGQGAGEHQTFETTVIEDEIRVAA